MRPRGSWTFLEIPFSVETAFGSKGRVAVAVTMNGFAFQNSLLPQGDGTHAMAKAVFDWCSQRDTFDSLRAAGDRGHERHRMNLVSDHRPLRPRRIPEPTVDPKLLIIIRL